MSVSVFAFRNFLEQLFVRTHPEESYCPCNNFTRKKGLILRFK